MTPEMNKCCALCLRKYQQELFIKISKHANETNLSAAECKKKLKKTVNFKLNLEHHVICRPCWILVETLADFRECCTNAEFLMEHANGSKYANESDPWFSNETMESITYIHSAVQSHVKFLEFEKLSKQTSVTHDEHIEVEPLIGFYNHSLENSILSQKTEKDDEEMEESESTPINNMEIEIFTCEKCSRRFDSKAGYSSHIIHCNDQKSKKNKTFVSCSICSASFETPQLLQYHLNKHKGSSCNISPS